MPNSHHPTRLRMNRRPIISPLHVPHRYLRREDIRKRDLSDSKLPPAPLRGRNAGISKQVPSPSPVRRRTCRPQPPPGCRRIQSHFTDEYRKPYRARVRVLTNSAGRGRWVWPFVTVLLLGALGAAYLFSGAFRGEVNRASGMLGSGDASALRDYILSYGAWAPVVSAALMVLQALAAFVPSFLLGFANGLAFGPVWGGLLSIVSGALAAAVSSGIARAVGRTPVEALVGRRSLGAADRWFARYGAYRYWPPGSCPWSPSMRSPTPPGSRG